MAAFPDEFAADTTAFAPPIAAVIGEDELARLKVFHLAQEVGALAVGRTVAYDPADRENSSIGYANLMEAIWFAARGEEKGRKVVETNARTHILECLMKAGVTFDVPIEMTSNGRLVQHGQLLEEVYENSLRWASVGPEMHERTLQEAYNGFVAANLFRRGLLEGQSMVVFSPYPTTTMTDEEARRIGFFPETKSLAIQRWTVRNGKLIQEVAFVAGTVESGGARHDLEAIRGMAAELGIDMPTGSSMAVLGTPVTIANTIDLLDIVKLYDKHAGVAAKQRVFFGQAASTYDYEAHLAVCRDRIANLEPLVQATVEEILLHAATLTHPLDAVELLHDVAQRRMVRHAMQDHTIDERVFGPVAMAHVAAARQALEVGDITAFQKEEMAAQATAITGSCPIDAARRGVSSSGASGEGGHENEGACPEIKDGQLVPCPSCRRIVRAIVPNKESIYCSNPACDLAPGYLRQIARRRKELNTKAQKSQKRLGGVAQLLAAA